MSRSKPCIWEFNEEGDVWETSCENHFVFIVNGPIQNEFRYCPFCGAHLMSRKGHELTEVF